MLPVVESYAVLLEMEAASIAVRWQRWDGGKPIETEYVCHGLRCRITLERIGPDPAPTVNTAATPKSAKSPAPKIDPNTIPTKCEQAIIDLLAHAGRRMMQPDIIAKLCPPHGESTVAQALAKLVRLGTITNVVKRGYGFPSLTDDDETPPESNSLPR